MKYWLSEVDANGFTYSIDNIRVNFEMKEDKLEVIKKMLNDINRADIVSYNPCFTQFKYKYLYTINYKHSSMSVGLCFNGLSRDDRLKGFLDFNPNKTMQDEKCMDDFRSIKSYCFNFELTRFDLAIDMPYSRDVFSLVKDNRMYQLVEKSVENKTEYLGSRNNAGFVKLYNKTIESELDPSEVLTRLEITFDTKAPFYASLMKFKPQIFIQSGIDRNISADLSNTQFVLLKLLSQVENPEEYLQMLDFRMKQKMRDYLYQGSVELNVDYEAGRRVLDECTRRLGFEEVV